MAFELGPIRSLRTILLSSALVAGGVVGCAVQDAQDEDAPVVLRHEGHDHPPAPSARPVIADAGSARAPANCASTFDAIQATIFDDSSYGCSSAACHGAPGGHLDLRKGYAYDALLGLAPHDAGAAHDHAAADAGHVHVHPISPADVAVYHDEDGSDDEGHHAHGAHVIAGQPEQSVLYDVLRAKVEGTTPKLGTLAMPLVGSAISKPQLEAIRLWIAGGAPRTGFVAGTEALCPELADAGR